MRREVDLSCKLSLLIATGGHEKFSFRLHSPKSCINVVSAVKYSKKKEIVKFLNQLMNQN